jgi:hypothetical protein
MALSEADERRVEAELRRMTTELQALPSQEKEDFVPTALLRFISAERRGEPLPEAASTTGLPPKRRFAWTLRPPR